MINYLQNNINKMILHNKVDYKNLLITNYILPKQSVN